MLFQEIASPATTWPFEKSLVTVLAPHLEWHIENSFVTAVALKTASSDTHDSRKWTSTVRWHFEKSFVTVVALKKLC